MMTDEPITLSNEVQARLDTHLDAIEQAMTQANASRSDRRNVVDEVEAQIRDMLAERCEGAATKADLEAVLAELDPPEAYGVEGAASDTTPSSSRNVNAASQDISHSAQSAGSAPSPTTRLSRTAVIGFGALLLSMALIPCVGIIETLSPVELTILALPAITVTPICGIIALVQIRVAKGQLYGAGLAVFDILLVPILVIGAIAFGVWYYLLPWMRAAAVPSIDPTDPPPIGLVLTLTAITTVVVGTVLIAVGWLMAAGGTDEGRANGAHETSHINRLDRQSGASSRLRRTFATGALSVGLAIAALAIDPLTQLIFLPLSRWIGPAALGEVGILVRLVTLSLAVGAICTGLPRWSRPLGKAGLIIGVIALAGAALYF
jgi:hypothetical protein